MCPDNSLSSAALHPLPCFTQLTQLPLDVLELSFDSLGLARSVFVLLLEGVAMHAFFVVLQIGVSLSLLSSVEIHVWYDGW